MVIVTLMPIAKQDLIVEHPMYGHLPQLAPLLKTHTNHAKKTMNALTLTIAGMPQTLTDKNHRKNVYLSIHSLRVLSLDGIRLIQ